MPIKKRKNRKAVRRNVKTAKTIKNISIKDIRNNMLKTFKQHIFRIILSILVLLLIIFSLRFIGTTGKAVLEMTPPASCSDTAIRDVWDSVIKENSSGSVVFTGSGTSGGCDNYLAYKITGTKAYLLIGSFIITPYLDVNHNVIYVNTTSITAVYGNFTDEYLSILRNSTSIDNLTSIYVVPDYVAQRNKTIPEAELEFKSEINMNDSQSWQSYTDDLGNTEYSYIIGSSNGTEDKSFFNIGTVLARYYFGQFDFIQRSISPATLANLTCTANWTEKITPCLGSEKQTKYYVDANSCPSPEGKPADSVIRCDFNGDGLYGHPSAFNTTIAGLSLYINGTTYSPSQNYLNNVSKKIEIKNRDNLAIIEFDWPFSSPLNLYAMNFRKQEDSDARGYLIVNGISASKKIIIDRKMNNSNAVCVKNEEIYNINQISTMCNATHEAIVPCPGSRSGYACDLDDDEEYFEISGLTNSGVIEMYYEGSLPDEDDEENCTPSWNCTSWSECINSQRTRTCSDINNCNSTANKPVESETCIPPCSPNWNCGNWTNCNKKTLKQVRVCTDANNCGTQENKPTESQDCEMPKSSTGKVLLIIGIIILILGIAGFAVWYLYMRNPAATEEGTEAGNVSWQAPPQPPASPPSYSPPAMPPQQPPSQNPFLSQNPQ